MIRDNTGRFAERPFYEARDLDNECERVIRELLLKRRGTVDLDLHRFRSGQVLMLSGPLFEGHG